ncbi:unnamed protein product [Rotaria sp. Silwood2]|nr:unnamed protein product [Rotaria sp. Silwood2]
MEQSCIGLSDLPDEILINIFQKLDKIDVLYSLEGVNQRINKVIQDRIFTSHLNFVKRLPHVFIDLLSSDMMLNRFCSQILPKIHDKIKWLHLESSSMKYVLCAANYPNLDTLSLNNIDQKSMQCLFNDEMISSNILKNQITTLFVTIDDNKETVFSMIKVCNYIVNAFTNLMDLTLYESSFINRIPLYFNDGFFSTFRSSTLLKLNIRICTIDDCLYLLDGRFNQLHTLYVDIVDVNPSEEIKNQDDLPNLKCFYLSCKGEACYYNNDYNCYNGLILPLLYRMLNLEELDLYIPVKVDKTFIDENDLKKNIINRMPRLNQFRFYIRSIMNIYSGMDLPSIEDIQYRFIEFANNNIISYVDYFSEAKQSQYHIYSYPSFMPYYSDITNYFPNRLFTYVRVVSLYDEHPFDHEFFLRIQKSFPFMETLNLTNQKPQNHKQSYESNNNNQNLSVIEYPFLNNLGIIHVHDDYIEQFLFDTKTYFRNNVVLHIKYESLQRVTHNFKRDATRINCAKINNLCLYGERYHSNSALKEYFPFAKICYPSIF